MPDEQRFDAGHTAIEPETDGVLPRSDKEATIGFIPAEIWPARRRVDVPLPLPERLYLQ